MGKIIETSYRDSVEKITDFNSNLINNTFYTLNDKKPTIVTYYNINMEASSLDPGSKIAYNNIGADSPLRFNKIDGFLVYGFDKIELQTDNEEFGMEADKISGDCYVLPNTIIPRENDYFEVNHIKDSTWLFIVTDVQRDTLENGSNAYKLTYKLEYIDHDRLQSQVVDEYKTIEKREGTQKVQVVESKKLDAAKVMDKIAVMLKHYYNELFYNEKVQTFTYVDLSEWRMYDPYMIEFLIRNKILDNGEDDYIFVTHQIEPVKTFSIDYDRTFFKVFEDCAKDKLLASEYTTMPEEIKSYGTTFAARFETYFKCKYIKPTTGYRAQCIPDELIFRIIEHDLVTSGDEDPDWYNIIIKYFYNEKYTQEDLLAVENMHFDTSMVAFYTIPLLIMILEKSIENALK